MNMIMDNPLYQHQPSSTPQETHNRTDLHVSTTPPLHLNTNMHVNNNVQMSPNMTISGAKSSLKRSFDVAFLMMPDERMKQKQAERHAHLFEDIESHHCPTDLSPRSQQQLNQQLSKQSENIISHDIRRYSHITIRAPRIYDDPSLVLPASEWEPVPLKSAFTKVASSRLESPVQLIPSLSPDQLSCPSVSPPVAKTPPRTGNTNDNSSIGNTISISQSINSGLPYQSFRSDFSPNDAFQTVPALQAQRIKQQMLYRPTLNPTIGTATTSNGNAHSTTIQPQFLPIYTGFSIANGTGGNTHSLHSVASPELPRIVQNPAAAAILSTLIPPTLASTFTLTAQNVCAKCNISFRMTSDLVYHMRSHHKNEVASDPNRRKREEKLKCPVCQESFRERHHLTRHMTAHQDKESDQAPNASSHSAHDITNTNSNNSSHNAPIRTSISK